MCSARTSQPETIQSRTFHPSIVQSSSAYIVRPLHSSRSRHSMPVDSERSSPERLLKWMDSFPIPDISECEHPYPLQPTEDVKCPYPLQPTEDVKRPYPLKSTEEVKPMEVRDLVNNNVAEDPIPPRGEGKRPAPSYEELSERRGVERRYSFIILSCYGCDDFPFSCPDPVSRYQDTSESPCLFEDFSQFPSGMRSHLTWQSVHPRRPVEPGGRKTAW